MDTFHAKTHNCRWQPYTSLPHSGQNYSLFPDLVTSSLCGIFSLRNSQWLLNTLWNIGSPF